MSASQKFDKQAMVRKAKALIDSYDLRDAYIFILNSCQKIMTDETIDGKEELSDQMARVAEKIRDVTDNVSRVLESISTSKKKLEVAKQRSRDQCEVLTSALKKFELYINEIKSICDIPLGFPPGFLSSIKNEDDIRNAIQFEESIFTGPFIGDDVIVMVKKGMRFRLLQLKEEFSESVNNFSHAISDYKHLLEKEAIANQELNRYQIELSCKLDTLKENIESAKTYDYMSLKYNFGYDFESFNKYRACTPLRCVGVMAKESK
jgi:hypothetical protein